MIERPFAKTEGRNEVLEVQGASVETLYEQDLTSKDEAILSAEREKFQKAKIAETRRQIQENSASYDAMVDSKRLHPISPSQQETLVRPPKEFLKKTVVLEDKKAGTFAKIKSFFGY